MKDDLTCCLADFGLSMICDSLATSSRIRGGPTRWLAPEVLLFSVGDNTEFPASDLPSRDMYAFACTAIEVRLSYILIYTPSHSPPCRSAVVNIRFLMFPATQLSTKKWSRGEGSHYRHQLLISHKECGMLFTDVWNMKR